MVTLACWAGGWTCPRAPNLRPQPPQQHPGGGEPHVADGAGLLVAFLSPSVDFGAVWPKSIHSHVLAQPVPGRDSEDVGILSQRP